MKKILIALLLTIPVLSGCLIVGTVDPSFTVTSASYKTNYLYNDGNTQSFAICNDRQTLLDYEFKYNGTLVAWESYLKGDKGGIAGRKVFELGDSGASIDNNNKAVKAGYTINPGGAPTLIAPLTVMPTITVDPKANVIGYSTLYITVAGFSDSQSFYSDKKMAVIDNCNDFIP
jgi:hypothetical protein